MCAIRQFLCSSAPILTAACFLCVSAFRTDVICWNIKRLSALPIILAPADQTRTCFCFLNLGTLESMDLVNICLLVVCSCALVYTLQLLYLNYHRLRQGDIADGRTKRRARNLCLLPTVCVGISLVATAVILARANSSDACFEDDNTVNPDVGGIGALLSLFSPCLILLFVLVLGHFTAENTGAKELCMAQCASR
jgi:hypothetical protein